ncbi:MAG: DEAD/DEAH box helicase [Candidatus Aenigmarchaeota archaeon]|nr:DEAD/DEAH box helicase [Candidatus Aenigmarchaeota archaeon]
MKIDKKEIVEKTLELFGFEKLNPVQKLAVDRGLMSQKNMIISAPTASGKTLCAFMAGLNCFLTNKKMIYLCPLVALAQEHYNNFKERAEKLGIKVALSIGDLDSSDPWLRDYDWIICSNEKADSLIRHGADWINEIGLIVVDEIHMLTDHSRGPTLEILLTRMKKILPNAQIIGLSATISNVKELAEWLDAEKIESEWRPVRLYEGVSFDSVIEFFGNRKYDLEKKLWHEMSILKNSIDMNKQALFFVASRRNAESLAEKLSDETRKYLSSVDVMSLKKIADEVINALDTPTKQCKRLGKCVENGIAFHHAGLIGKQKKIIEDNFRKGIIKAIVATPTLAQGVNTPSHRVIIRDVKRFYAGIGARYIPVFEYKQMAGRAGRPEFNSEGESILIAKNEEEAFELAERYINGESEEIQSKLALEPVLRMHVLALISSGFVKNLNQLYDFFRQTFYAHQYGDISGLDVRIERILERLIEFGFVVRINDDLKPTKIGKRISELYIDPLTGHMFVEALNKKVETNNFGYLQLVSSCLEMKPLLSLTAKDIKEVEEKFMQHEKHFMTNVPKEWEDEYEEFMQSIKTTLVIDDWINEKSEDDILNKRGVTPGELRTRLTNADWLLYSLSELALLLGFKESIKDLRKLRIRVKHGIKEELIPLIRLQGVGRMRARKLYSHNLKTLEDLRNTDIIVLSKIVGNSIASSIKKQLGEDVDQKQKFLEL